ncbi:hypothetical protein A5747_22100 [Mycobacterium sp. IS-836]|nr:hypothetical protein A5747_22100 [Mycobacterium sp. IS-836]
MVVRGWFGQQPLRNTCEISDPRDRDYAFLMLNAPLDPVPRQLFYDLDGSAGRVGLLGKGVPR